MNLNQHTSQPLSSGDRSLGPVVLLGGAGKTGRRVLDRLEHRGVPARPASRSTAVPFDWDDPGTWTPALDGADAAYLTFQPDLALPGAADVIARIAVLAADLGVARLVLLSGRGEVGAVRSEQALLSAHPGATVVRCSWFAQNFSEGMLADSVAEGVIALPVPPHVPEPFVDLDDVAEVVVDALTGRGHAGTVHELTGPDALTFPEAASLISRAGRPVRYVTVSEGEFVEGAVAAGVPGDLATFLAGLFAELMDGRNAVPTNGVAAALGRPATGFGDFVSRVAWQPIDDPQRTATGRL